jgi:hypothetical protein
VTDETLKDVSACASPLSTSEPSKARGFVDPCGPPLLGKGRLLPTAEAKQPVLPTASRAPRVFLRSSKSYVERRSPGQLCVLRVYRRAKVSSQLREAGEHSPVLNSIFLGRHSTGTRQLSLNPATSEREAECGQSAPISKARRHLRQNVELAQ